MVSPRPPGWTVRAHGKPPRLLESRYQHWHYLRRGGRITPRSPQYSDHVTITPLTTERFADFAGLMQALADYEELDGPDSEALQRLRADAFAPRPRFEAALALDETGRAIGYAVWFETYSTFLARPTIYLEDIFVLEDARQRGAGGLLFDHVRALGARRGCGRME